MTETEWLQSDDPAAMLAAVVDRTLSGRERLTNRVSDRKLRLFACACCRGVWDQLTNALSREAVLVAERFADNPSGEQGMECRRACYAADDGIGHCVRSLHRESEIAADNASFYARQIHGQAPVQAALLREIVGNPWRPVKIGTVIVLAGDMSTAALESGASEEWRPPHWLTREVVGIAAAIYDRRSFDELPILADALTEAGCEDEAILLHLRGMEQVPITPEVTERTGSQARTMLVPLRGPHVRGCWALDLILGQS
jgi:hypothetical protein